MVNFRNLASTLFNRERLASAIGKSFGGDRDVYKQLGYKTSITPSDYRERYERGDIAARIVEMYPEDTWAGEVELIEDPNPETITAFEQAWYDLNDRHGAVSKLFRTDLLSRLGRYAVLLIGAPGNLDTEIPKATSAANRIMYLMPFAEEFAPIKKYDEDPQSERFGRPEFYALKVHSGSGSTDTVSGISVRDLDVHHSRVIHYADNPTQSDIFGVPCLERIFNRLDDLDKVLGAGSEAFWRLSYPGLHVDISPDVEWNPDKDDDGKTELQQFQDKVDDFANNLTRVLRTRGADVSALSGNPNDFSNSAETLLNFVSGATGIPKRLLMGSERGELASSQDVRTWNKRVRNRRTTRTEPNLLRPFVDRLVEYGYMPEPKMNNTNVKNKKRYEAKWPELDDMTIEEKAKVAGEMAKQNRAAGETIVTGAEIRDKVYGYEKLDDEAIDRAVDLDPLDNEPDDDEEGQQVRDDVA